MDNNVLEEYGEAILYVLLAVMILGMMIMALGAFTAF